MNPTVTVIIPTYNRAELLLKAINSVLNQTYQDFEIIVGDNGSTDNTKDVVSSINDKRIKYFYRENSGGPSEPRNDAVKIAKGDYIAFLDSDDIWLPEKLEKQIPLLKKNKDVGLVYTDSFRKYIDTGAEERNFLTVKPYRGKVFAELLEKLIFPISSVVIRKEVINDIGVFNPVFQVLQDYDLWLRIAEKWEYEYVNSPLCYEILHTKNLRVMGRGQGLKDWIKILDFWEPKNVISKKEFLRAKMNVYCVIGMVYIREMNDTKLARNYFLTAFKMHKRLKPVCLFFISFGGDFILRKVKKIRRKCFFYR